MEWCGSIEPNLAHYSILSFSACGTRIMYKNTASQQWIVFAFQDEGGSNPAEPVTGDASNITANVRIDAGGANGVDDINPTEMEDGYYSFGITAAESNGDSIMIAPVSATANVNVIGVPGAVYTRTDVSAIEGKIDTIQTATDKLKFTVTNEVDSNVQSINDATVIGDGNVTPWDGA